MTRQIQRAIVHKVEKEIGAIDAFLDLVQFIRSEKPAAVLDAGAALAKRSLEFLKSTKFAFTDLSPLHQFSKRFQHLLKITRLFQFTILRCPTLPDRRRFIATQMSKRILYWIMTSELQA